MPPSKKSDLFVRIFQLLIVTARPLVYHLHIVTSDWESLLRICKLLVAKFDRAREKLSWQTRINADTKCANVLQVEMMTVAAITAGTRLIRILWRLPAIAGILRVNKNRK